MLVWKSAFQGALHVLVPEALQIGRQAARPGAAHQQVAAELEVQGRQARIVGPLLHRRQPLVGGPRPGRRRRAPRSTSLTRRISPRWSARWSLANGLEALCGGRLDLLLADGLRVLVPIGGGRRQEQRNGVGLVDRQPIAFDRELAALGHDFQLGLELHAPAAVGRSRHDQPVGRRRPRSSIPAGGPSRPRRRSGPACRTSVARPAPGRGPRQRYSRVNCASPSRYVHRRHARVQVELAAVVGRLSSGRPGNVSRRSPKVW